MYNSSTTTGASPLWKSEGHSPAEVNLMPSDPGFLKQAGDYTIRVKAVTTSNYTLTASSAVAVTELQSGIPQTEDVPGDEYKYFQIRVPNDRVDLVIDVTPLTGDPDIYVGCFVRPTNKIDGFPSVRNYNFSSTAWGEDTIRIEASNPEACHYGKPDGATFFIAVYGFSDSSYSVMAFVDDGMPSSLVDGFPQLGMVIHRQFMYYTYFVPDSAPNVTISVTPYYGDPDLYVSMGSSGSFDADKPTLDKYAYRAQNVDGRESVTLFPGGNHCHDPNDNCYCSNCYVYIGVYGYDSSSYSITAAAAESTKVLQDGTPVRGSVGPHAYSYYRFTVRQHNRKLKISVTPVSGDPDLVVSTDTPRPTIHTPNAKVSQRWGYDEIVIEDAPVGVYYIGVLGVLPENSFSLLAQSDEGLADLSDGQPTGGVVAAGEYDYYGFIVAGNKESTGDINFVVVPTNGQVSIYINKCESSNRTACAHDARPTTAVYTWSSIHAASRTSFSIPASDPKACWNCTYVIGVYGRQCL